MENYGGGTEKAHFHLPGLFEFYEFYKIFLPLFFEHREYFYDWACIDSIYGAPADCIWGGGRAGFGSDDAKSVLSLLTKYGISARLTFSNSLLREEHLSDRKCNRLCKMFAAEGATAVTDTDEAECTGVKSVKNGVILHSEVLLDYLKKRFPGFYFVSSTTKVITDFDEFEAELRRDDFSYVVPDFRLNKQFEKLRDLPADEKSKVEFLCNECCWVGCKERKSCYENVSRKILGENCPDFICRSPGGNEGYRFSQAMKSPAFISVKDIQEVYLPSGFSNFKIEGRGLGNAILLEFLLYYLVKPECQLTVREEVYLDCMVDLF